MEYLKNELEILKEKRNGSDLIIILLEKDLETHKAILASQKTEIDLVESKIYVLHNIIDFTENNSNNIVYFVINKEMRGYIKKVVKMYKLNILFHKFGLNFRVRSKNSNVRHKKIKWDERYLGDDQQLVYLGYEDRTFPDYVYKFGNELLITPQIENLKLEDFSYENEIYYDGDQDGVYAFTRPTKNVLVVEIKK